MAQRLTGHGSEYGELPLRPILERQAGDADTPRHLSWYEADPERYEAEERAMRALGFVPKLYQDGRIVFGGLVHGASVVVFLEHLNPVKPPSLFIVSDNVRLPGDAFNPDGSVDLFYGNHYWNPSEMTASILITWLEELMSQSGYGDCSSVRSAGD